MKMKSGFFLPVATIGFLLLVTGCSSISVSTYREVGGLAYAPSDPAQIEILRAMPNRAYVQLGEITAEPLRPRVGVQKIESSLRQAAARMGANAVVIVSDPLAMSGDMVTRPSVVMAIAIKYTTDSVQRPAQGP